MSFVEVMVALLILLLVGAGISHVLATSWQSQATLTAQDEAERRAQHAIDAVVDRLRSGSGVVSGGSAQVSVFFPAGNTQTYSLQAGNLVCHDSATGQTTTICAGVPGFAIRYGHQVNGVWNAASTPTAAESLEISVTVNVQGRTAVETSVVELRNKALTG